MDTYQISGSMVVTNTQRLHDPRFSAYADMFKAMMDNNLMDFRLLKNGVAELSDSGDVNRKHLTSEAFVASLSGFMNSVGIPELELSGHFLFIETKRLQPSLVQVTVDKSTVSTYTGTVTWTKQQLNTRMEHSR